MKKTVTIVAMLCFSIAQLSIYAQTNLNFESWSGNDPQSWNSSNGMTTLGGGSQTVFKETTSPASGSASLKLVTGSCPKCPTILSDNSFGLIDCVFPNPFGGSVELGDSNTPGGTPGMPYSKRPLSVDIKYKSKPATGDAGGFYLKLTKYNTTTSETDEVGYAYFEAKTTVDNWTTLNIPVVYYSTEIPDTINIYISSSIGSVMDCSNSAIFVGMPSPYTSWGLPVPAAGSEFYLDDIIINLPSCESLKLTMSGTAETGLGAGDGTATATVTGGTAPYTYAWSTLETGTTINTLITGTYFVVITDANACERTGQYIVTNPGCNIGLTVTGTKSNSNSIYSGTGSISVTATGASSFQFTWNNGSMNTGTSSSVTNLAVGSYAVLIEDLSSSLCATWGYYVVLGPNSPAVGVKELVQSPDDLLIYPNPSNGMMNVAGNDVTTITIYSIDGKKVYENKVNSSFSNINVKDVLSSGNYILEVKKLNGNKISKEIIIE